MPKVKGKGGKNRRRGKNHNFGDKRELLLKTEMQEYAQVIRMLGHGRLEANCFDNQKRLCHIRGKMRKKVWITVGDIVLLSLREYQDDKGDVIYKYTPDEARQLKQQGEIPDLTKINEFDGADDNDLSDAVEFGDVAAAESDVDEESSSLDDDDLDLDVI
ncbi:MAG: uncharacterized protein KVP18_000542 [Porospora cf. gigantea A]|uniref:uncharacterized protein n=1 Tax=Porospora cf. gigantea A TaxID=2853593 RepID=UPI00355958EF|nr:MAG: hypothetical protein KVP18_000542 [Porospora cf. gigantea A]